jgi:AraC-like DNA-binding protein
MSRPRTTSVIALDDRAVLAVYSVDSRLADRVNAYWTLSVEAPPARVRVIPDGQVDLVFDLDRGEAHIGGAPNAAFEVTHDRPTHLLGATFLPGAAAALLDAPAGSLTTAWQPLAAVLGPVAGAVAHHVASAPDLDTRLAVVETFLLRRLRQTDPRVDRAVRAIEASGGQLDVERLGRRSGASARNLSRLFHQWVGLPPKRFARIVRAQVALRRLTGGTPVDLAALAAELGFSDHAHLTREVRTVLGEAPSTLAGTFKRTSDSFKR